MVAKLFRRALPSQLPNPASYRSRRSLSVSNISLVRALFALLCLVGSTCPLIASVPATPSITSARTDLPLWPKRLRDAMTRLAAVEWQLKEAAGSLCPVQRPSIGAMFDDRSAYDSTDWTMLATTLDMHARPQIFFVAPDSPAGRAGMRADDTLLSIDGQDLEVPATGTSPSMQVLDHLARIIDELPVDRPTRFAVMRRGSTLTLDITPVTICGARFALTTSGRLEAHSDGVNLAIAAGLVDFTRNDDEMAFILGHELSHVIFQDGAGDLATSRRAKESRADRTGAALTRCAGYDVTQAFGVLSRISRRGPLAWLGDPTHGSAKVRRNNILLAATDPCPTRRGVL